MNNDVELLGYHRVQVDKCYGRESERAGIFVRCCPLQVQKKNDRATVAAQFLYSYPVKEA